MTMRGAGLTAVMAVILNLTMVLGAFAEVRVVDTTFPAHSEWCSKTEFDQSLFQSPVGQDSVMTRGAAPILDAAFKASAKTIGHVYIRAFRPEGSKVTATFCAGVPSSLQTDDAAISVEQVPAVPILGAVCPDPDECMSGITTVLKDSPYKLTQGQIEALDWHYAPALKQDSSADALAAGLIETDSTPISKEAVTNQAPDEHVFTIVAVPKPAQ